MAKPFFVSGGKFAIFNYLLCTWFFFVDSLRAYADLSQGQKYPACEYGRLLRTRGVCGYSMR